MANVNDAPVGGGQRSSYSLTTPTVCSTTTSELCSPKGCVHTV